MRNAGIVIAAVAGTMLLVVLIAMPILARHRRRRRSRLPRLATTMGRVRMAEPRRRGNSRLPTHWVVDLAVEFTVQGRRHVCRDLDFGTHRYATEEEMRAALRGLVPGAPAQVWYDPLDPSCSALGPKVPGDPGLIARVAFGLALVVAAGVLMDLLG